MSPMKVLRGSNADTVVIAENIAVGVESCKLCETHRGLIGAIKPNW